MREISNFLNFGKKGKEEKQNREVSKIFNFGNLKKADTGIQRAVTDRKM